MSWGSAHEFFAMGGYGPYIWGAYGLTAALLAFETWAALRRRRRALADAIGDAIGAAAATRASEREAASR